MPGHLLKGAEYLFSECSADGVFVPEDFDDEQKQLARTIDRFVAQEVLPEVERLEAQDFDRMVGLLKKSGELGLLMIEAPEEYGGMEMNKATGTLAAERISRYGGFMVAYMVLTGIGLLPLVYYGTPDQKRKYLGKLVRGEWMSAYCLTEPDCGSDALGARTSAVLSPDGKHYILNGTKQFITNGGFADLYTVFAKVDRKHFTAFLVERSFRGVSPGPEENKLGIKGSSTTQVVLEDVPVPVENVLGEIGKGHKIAFNVLNVGRFKLGAAVVGNAKAALVEGVTYANQRRQFGVPVGTFGAVREKIADMTAAVFAAESLVYRLAGMIDDRLAAIPRGIPGYYEAYQRGIEEYAAECAIAKVHCSEMLARVVDEVVQIHGGYGFIREYTAERLYRDERVNRIYEGTNEINRILIPGILLRRAGKGEIPLDSEVRKAREAFSGRSSAGPRPSGPFAAERELLQGLKLVFLAVSGAALARCGDRLKEEQETLMALADIAIRAFALESSLLRAARIRRALPPSREAVLDAVVKLCAFDAAETAAAAARKAACFIEEGEGLAPLLDGIRRLARYDPVGLLGAKRALALAALEAERYVFDA